MARTIVVEAIILKTYDVGEGDRFCILFTKQRGRIAARARGVRKPGSKMGGTVLPVSHVTLQLSEGSAGYLITDAKKISADCAVSMRAFLNAQQGMELLLCILHDEEPLPELFETTLLFIHTCTHVLPFTLKLLLLMGLLPSLNDTRFDRFSDGQKLFFSMSIGNTWENLPDLSVEQRAEFSALCAELVSHINTMPLRAGGIIRQILSNPVEEECRR